MLIFCFVTPVIHSLQGLHQPNLILNAYGLHDNMVNPWWENALLTNITSLVPICFRACGENLTQMFLKVCKACPIMSGAFRFQEPPIESHAWHLWPIIGLLYGSPWLLITTHDLLVGFAEDDSLPIASKRHTCSVVYHWWCGRLEFLRWWSGI